MIIDQTGTMILDEGRYSLGVPEQFRAAVDKLPEPNGYLYSLTYMVDGSDGMSAGCLGVSEDWQVLIRAMLDDVVEYDRDMELAAAVQDERGCYSFSFEETPPQVGGLYLDYHLQMTPRFPGQNRKGDCV